MTDESILDSTVEDDGQGSLGDREIDHETLPSAPPIPDKGLVSLTKSTSCEPEAAICCTNVVHNRLSDDASNPCGVRDFSPSDCCTSMVHNRRQTMQGTARAEPSGNGRPEQPQPSPSRSRRPPGLIVRGRVFYLRLRVPRSLVSSVGRRYNRGDQSVLPSQTGGRGHARSCISLKEAS
jgi:hypothetical protein